MGKTRKKVKVVKKSDIRKLKDKPKNVEEAIRSSESYGSEEAPSETTTDGPRWFAQVSYFLRYFLFSTVGWKALFKLAKQKARWKRVQDLFRDR